MNDLFNSIGYEFSIFLNSVPTALSDFFHIFRLAGREEFYILILPLLFWCINKSLGKRLVILATLSSFIGYFLKDLFAVPRPDKYFTNNLLVNRAGVVSPYLFPSVHLMVTGSFWGFLSINSKRKLSRIVCYLVVVGALLSRIIHGVQTPISMAFSLVLAICIIILFHLFQGRVAQAYNTQYTLLQRVLVVLIVSLGLLILSYIFSSSNYESVLISIALFTGGISGIILEKEMVGFKVDGNLEVRLLRYIIGIILLSFIYILSNLLINLTDGSSILIFTKYLLLSFTGTFIIPLIFLRMKLAQN